MRCSLSLAAPFRGCQRARNRRELVLTHDLRLFEELGEQDEERTERHDAHDRDGGVGNETAGLRASTKPNLFCGAALVAAAASVWISIRIFLSRIQKRQKLGFGTWSDRT
jgi:hypothetical protein